MKRKIFFKGRDLSRPAKAGFTLIEIMVVISIIGILASIISVSLVSSRAKGRDAKRVSDIRTIQLALETYYTDNGAYPISIYPVTGGPLNNYLPRVPVDPYDNQTQYKYVAWNAAQSQNCTPSSPAIAYHLGAGLEDSNNSALKQDADQNGRETLTGVKNCGGTAIDFDGRQTTTNNACTAGTAATGLGAPPETCYDVTN